MPYIFALLATWGLSWTIADSKISFPIRKWIGGSDLAPINVFLECPACTSFWIGLVAALVFLDLQWLAIPFAFMSCGTSLVFFLAIRRLDR